jgi:hypothetical protein
MRLSHFLVPGVLVVMASACAAPQADAPPQAAPAAVTVAPSAMPTPTKPAEPTATSTLPPTATATPTAAPGTLPINAETLGQLRQLWMQDYSVEESDSGCFLMDCWAPSRVLASSFSPDGGQLALGYCESPRNNRSNPRHYEYYCEASSQVILLDAETGEEQLRLDTADVPLALAFHPERPILAAGLANRDIELWDLETRTKFRTLSHSSKRTGVNNLAFSPDGQLLVSEGDSTLQVWNWENPPFLQDAIRSTAGIAFSPDGHWMATEHLPTGSDGAYRIRLYDLPYTGHFTELPTQTGWRLVFSPTHPVLAAVGSTETQIWDAESGERLRRYPYDGLGPQAFVDMTTQFLPEGLLLWSMTESDYVPTEDANAEPTSACGPLLWDPLEGSGWYTRFLDEDCFKWEDAFAAYGGFTQRRLSPDGRLLFSQRDGVLQVSGIDPAIAGIAPTCVGECPEP